MSKIQYLIAGISLAGAYLIFVVFSGMVYSKVMKSSTNVLFIGNTVN